MAIKSLKELGLIFNRNNQIMFQPCLSFQRHSLHQNGPPSSHPSSQPVMPRGGPAFPQDPQLNEKLIGFIKSHDNVTAESIAEVNFSHILLYMKLF